MSHPMKEMAKKGHAKKLEGYGGKSKKTDVWSGDEPDLNTSGKPAGLMPIMKEPKLSEDTNPEIMRKAGGKVSPKRMDKAPRKAKGGKLSNFEGSAKDEAQDKKLAKKHGMSFKKWESSSLDKKHDEQQSMKGLKKGGRTERKAGGRIGRDMGGAMVPNKKGGPTNITLNLPGSGGQSPMAPGGAGMPGMAPPPAMPPMGAMPPGGAMPPMGLPAPGPMPGGMPGAVPPGAPMPPTGSPPGGVNNPMMLGRKKGGRINSTTDLTAGAGSGEGRLQKTELQK